jgi:hypothetical protein
MRVRWSKFSAEGYDYACKYAEDDEIPKMEDFIIEHEGEVIGTFSKKDVPYFLINENDKIVEYPAMECKIVTEFNYI